MSGQMYGADVAELERLASEFRRTAEELNNEGSVLTGILNRVAWLGDIATNYVGDWTGVQIPKIGLSTQFLNDAADNLLRQAEEQRQASESGGVARGPDTWKPGPQGPSEAKGDDETSTRLRDLLLEFGLDPSVIGPLLEAIVESRAGRMIIDALGNGTIDVSVVKSFVGMIDIISDVESVIDAAVSFFDDFAEYPDLPLDERVLHAAINAAAAIATTVGVEVAVTAAVSAAATAIGLTGAGVFIGKTLGGLISMGVEKALEYGDNRFDVVDSFIADPVVEGWRDIKKGAQLTGEIYDTISEGAGDVEEKVGEFRSDVIEGSKQVRNYIGQKKDEMWNKMDGWL